MGNPTPAPNNYTANWQTGPNVNSLTFGTTMPAGGITIPLSPGQPTWYDTYNGWSVINQHKLFSIFNSKQELVLLIDRAGNVVFGVGAKDWDEAAKSFWQQVAANNPLRFHIETLQEDNRMLTDVIGQLHIEIQKLKEQLANGT
jgi:ligand-binding sensor domain-containing protein